MGLDKQLKEDVLNLIEVHLDNIRNLIACTDNSEKSFSLQLQSEFRYFSDIKKYFSKNESVPAVKILILEKKLEHYKKTNRYRYNIAKKIVDLNNSYVEEEIPF